MKTSKKILNKKIAFKKSGVVFDDFDWSAKSGVFPGHIEIPPRFVNYQLLVRYEAKIAAHLINAGFAVKKVLWDIETDAAEINFWADVSEIN